MSGLPAYRIRRLRQLSECNFLIRKAYYKHTRSDWPRAELMAAALLSALSVAGLVALVRHFSVEAYFGFATAIFFFIFLLSNLREATEAAIYLVDELLCRCFGQFGFTSHPAHGVRGRIGLFVVVVIAIQIFVALIWGWITAFDAVWPIQPVRPPYTGGG